MWGGALCVDGIDSVPEGWRKIVQPFATVDIVAEVHKQQALLDAFIGE